MHWKREGIRQQVLRESERTVKSWEEISHPEYFTVTGGAKIRWDFLEEVSDAELFDYVTEHYNRHMMGD